MTACGVGHEVCGMKEIRDQGSGMTEGGHKTQDEGHGAYSRVPDFKPHGGEIFVAGGISHGYAPEQKYSE